MAKKDWLILTILVILTGCDLAETRTANPVFDPPGGFYHNTIRVRITCATSNAVILYRIKDETNWNAYRSDAETELYYHSVCFEAMATNQGMQNSEIVIVFYSFSYTNRHKVDYVLSSIVLTNFKAVETNYEAICWNDKTRVIQHIHKSNINEIFYDDVVTASNVLISDFIATNWQIKSYRIVHRYPLRWGKESDYNGVEGDRFGNLYLMGRFSGTVDFDWTENIAYRTSSSSSVSDTYILKLNSDNEFQDVTIIPGSADKTESVFCIDPSGNLFIAGVFQRTIDADPGSGFDLRISFGVRDVFITRINADGSYGWTRSFGSTGDETVNGIECDGSGQLYVAGGFEQSADFNPGAGKATMTAAGGSDAYLLVLTTSGDYVRAKQWGGTQNETGTAVAVGSNGASVLIGVFCGSDDIDYSSYDLWKMYMLTNEHRFVVAFKADGNQRWEISDAVKAANVDGSGNVYLAGEFSDSRDCNPFGGLDIRKSSDDKDVYFTKIGSDDSYQWTKTFGGNNDDTCFQLCIDPSGIMYLAGASQSYRGDNPDFDPGPATNYIDDIYGDIAYVSIFESDGTYRWTRAYEFWDAIYLLDATTDGLGDFCYILRKEYYGYDEPEIQYHKYIHRYGADR